MLLHADVSQQIKSPYQMVSINYFPTSVQRLYQIGSTSGEWLEYKDEAIKVNQGVTIYAKGIDKYGNETRVTSSYTANVTDALGVAAYDGNESTYVVNNSGSRKINVDSSLWGKKINVKGYAYAGYKDEWIHKINFCSETGKTLVESITYYQCTSEININLVIPNGTKYIDFWSGSETTFYIRVNEISIL